MSQDAFLSGKLVDKNGIPPRMAFYLDGVGGSGYPVKGDGSFEMLYFREGDRHAVENADPSSRCSSG